MAIVMAGNFVFRNKLLDEFAAACGEYARQWIIEFISSYGLIEIVNSSVCRFGDTASNQA